MKRLFLPALLLAGAMSSCSKDEVTSVAAKSDAQTVNTVGFDFATAVTRGAETTADGIRTGSDVTLYFASNATASDVSGSEVYTSGWINYDYSEAWSQAKYNVGSSDVTVTTDDNELYWSNLGFSDEDGATNPTVYFYSMNDGANNHVLDTYTTTSATGVLFTPLAGFVGSTTPTNKVSEQVDLVHYAGTISSIPGAGEVRATFDHSLSRFEMYSNQGEYNPYIKSVTFCNLYGSATPTLTTSNGAVTWNFDAGASQNTNYLYFTRIDGSGATESNGELMYDSYIIGDYDGAILQTSDNMMIIPQTLASGSEAFAAIQGNKGTSDLSDQGAAAVTATLTGIPYIAVIYRMTDAGATSVVGYLNASDCDEYQTLADASSVTPTSVGDDSHLYVLVGFPFTSDITLKSGSHYNLNLGFGVTGGILLSDFYYTSYGEETNIRIAGLEPGDYVIPGVDTPIGLTITVTDWTTESDTELN